MGDSVVGGKRAKCDYLPRGRLKLAAEQRGRKIERAVAAEAVGGGCKKVRGKVHFGRNPQSGQWKRTASASKKDFFKSAKSMNSDLIA